MTRSERAKMMARKLRLTNAQAADRLDQVVTEILNSVRRGEEASIPGLGKFRCDSGNAIQFEPEQRRPAGARDRA